MMLASQEPLYILIYLFNGDFDLLGPFARFRRIWMESVCRFDPLDILEVRHVSR